MRTKKVLSILVGVSILIVTIVIPMGGTINVSAENNGVLQRINELSNLFPTGSYFTTTGTNSCNTNIYYGNGFSYCYSLSCPTCHLGNVLEKNSKAKNTIVPSVCLRGGRYSCYGFATFVFCYIFEHDPDISVSTISSVNYGGINNNFLSQLKPGDLIECDDGKLEHYAIFLKYDSNYIYLYESNFDNPNQVEYNHKRTWNRWKTIKAYRSNYYNSIAEGQTLPSDNVKDYYKLTAPDGYQTVRAQATTSSANVGTLYTGDIVCVTKYNSDRSWGYIDTGTISGWIMLYYVEAVSPPSDYYKLTSPDGYQTVRAEATTSSANVGTLYTGDIVYVSKYNSDRSWGYIDNGVISGWIMLYYVEATTHSHIFGNWSTETNATCTSNGSEKRKCTNCSTVEKRIVSASGHKDYNYNWLYYPNENSNGEFGKYCGICNKILNTYDIPWITLESIVFTKNTIQCKILKPDIDSELSYFISPIPYVTQNDEISVKISEDDKYKIYTIDDIALLKEYGNFNIDILFGAGELPYSLNPLHTINLSFENIANDINGDFENNATDVILLKKKLLGADEIETGDTNSDGKTDILDLIHLKKHLITT